ncbi:MAG: hypothetical protein EOP56_16645 [Sphingobacteriales bacterium]|nr:MAG: hypothetical protein EOP56_16645 [Sphingobacteriales bacterium]
MSAAKSIGRFIKWVFILIAVPFFLLIISGFVYGIMSADSYEAVSAYANFRNNKTDNNIEAAYKDAQNVLKLSKDDSTLADVRDYISQYPALQKKKQEENAHKAAEETRMRFAYNREKNLLVKNFSVFTDEYGGAYKYFHHKSIPNFNSVDTKSFYLYFGMPRNVDKPASLFLRVNYLGDHALDIKDVTLLVDGNTLRVEFPEVKQKNIGSRIAEWGEIDLIAGDAEILHTLANAKTVKMRLNGKDIADEIVLNKKQIAAASETYRLFNAMGGRLDTRTAHVDMHNRRNDHIAGSFTPASERESRIKRTRVVVSKRHWLMGGGYTIREEKLDDHGYDGVRIN